MARKSLLIAVFAIMAAALLNGCSTAVPFFNQEQPGAMPAGGGTLQLFFANPDYTTIMSDKYLRDEYMRDQALGSRSSYPSVNGGIGLMEVWHF